MGGPNLQPPPRSPSRAPGHWEGRDREAGWAGSVAPELQPPWAPGPGCGSYWVAAAPGGLAAGWGGGSWKRAPPSPPHLAQGSGMVRPETPLDFPGPRGGALGCRVPGSPDLRRACLEEGIPALGTGWGVLKPLLGQLSRVRLGGGRLEPSSVLVFPPLCSCWREGVVWGLDPKMAPWTLREGTIWPCDWHPCKELLCRGTQALPVRGIALQPG